MVDPSETTQVSHDPADPEQAELIGAVRTLSAQVGGLQAELQSLRAQRRGLPVVAESPGWDESGTARRETTWMRALDSPGPRAPAVPRLLLEVLFLVAVAVGAVLAELDPLVIVALMALAWGLVALAEWLAAQAARRREEASRAPVAGIGAVFAEDPSWFAPPLERTALEVGEDTEDDIGEDTATRLPPRSSE